MLAKIRTYIREGKSLSARDATREMVHQFLASHPEVRLRGPASRFDTWSEAFQRCRDRNAPLTVIVAEPCDECKDCRESKGGKKRRHKIYPSGVAVSLGYVTE